MTLNIIACLAVAGVGLLLMLISIPFFVREKSVKKKCTAQTTGTVVKYKMGGQDNNRWFSPVAEFYVNEKKYKAYRHFNGVKRVRIKKLSSEEQQSELRITDKDMFSLHIVGEFCNIKYLVEEKWPLGMEVPIVYNPAKPRQAFVEKVVVLSKVAGIVLLSCGCGFVLLAGIAYMIF